MAKFVRSSVLPMPLFELTSARCQTPPSDDAKVPSAFSMPTGSASRQGEELYWAIGTVPPVL